MCATTAYCRSICDAVIYQVFELGSDRRVAVPVGGGSLQAGQEVGVQTVQLRDLEEDGVEVVL